MTIMLFFFFVSLIVSVAQSKPLFLSLKNDYVNTIPIAVHYMLTLSVVLESKTDQKRNQKLKN